VIALLSGAALVVSACSSGSGTGTSSGGSGQQQNQNPGAIGAQDQIYKRPKVSDIGEIAYGTEEPPHEYNNNIGANNSFANTEGLSNTQPGPFFADFVDGKIVLKLDGDLLSSFTVKSTNPEVLEYKIRPEAVWSDGVAIDCKDFYLQWMSGHSKVTKKGADGKDASIWDTSPTGYEDINKIDCSDNNKTVTATFGKQFADYRSLFSFNNPLLPAHIVEQQSGVPDITKVTDTDVDAQNKMANFYTTGWNQLDNKALDLSGGPYLVDSSDMKTQTVLVRNPKWWGNPAGPSKVTIRGNGDAQSLAQQLTNKELQVIAPQADGAVATSLRNDSTVQVFAAGGQTFEHIDFNFKNPLFKDIAVRKAISACIPRQRLVDTLVKDVDPNAKPLGNQMFMPNEQGYEDHYADTGNGDVAAAKKILEDAGYTLGSDGIYAKGGQRVSFKLGHKVVQRREDTVRIVQAQCRQAGIDVVDDQAEDFNDARLPAGEWEAALFAWVGTPFKSSSYGNYASVNKGGSANYQAYSNPQFDDLYTQANAELDFTKRTQDMNQLDKIMHDDVASVPLFQLPDFSAADKALNPITYVGVSGGADWNNFAWQKS
jgi:peptide/nickel transport system substrate-binding protein